MAFDLDLSLVNLRGDRTLSHMQEERRGRMVPQNGRLKLHRLQAPTAFFWRPHPTLYQTYETCSRVTFNMTLSAQLLSMTCFSPLLGHTVHHVGPFFFFNINYLFFN